MYAALRVASHLDYQLVHPFLRLSSLASFPIDIAGNAFVRFPFLIHVRTNLVLALLFCQPVSFLDIEYHAQSHFSYYHVLF